MKATLRFACGAVTDVTVRARILPFVQYAG